VQSVIEFLCVMRVLNLLRSFDTARRRICNDAHRTALVARVMPERPSDVSGRRHR
jgi:hypothetical protein